MTRSGRIWFLLLDGFSGQLSNSWILIYFFRLFGWTEISLSRGSVLPWAAASSPPWPYGSTLWVAVVQQAKLIRVMSLKQHEDLILLFEEGYVRAHQNASLFSAKATNYPSSSPVISLKDSLGLAEILSRCSTFDFMSRLARVYVGSIFLYCETSLSFAFDSHHWTPLMWPLYISLFLHFMF